MLYSYFLLYRGLNHDPLVHFLNDHRQELSYEQLSSYLKYKNYVFAVINIYTHEEFMKK